ncbi:MAG: translocation/assembly module TamB domain-containing protein [Acidobacteria bacterium]|nr:translocation/assembly module TamB domain-containing protein [Acidobacteriota bacterium]
MSALIGDSAANPGKSPDRPPTRRRRRTWWIATPVALLVALLALSYTAPVQRWAFDRVVVQLQDRFGIAVRAEHVTFAPLGLRVTLDGVSIASRATPATPYFTATHVDIGAQWGVLKGRPIIKRLRIVDPVVDLTKVAGGNGDGKPFRGLGSLQLGEVAIDNFSFFVGGPTSTRVAIRKLSLKGTGDAPGRLRLESVSPGMLLLEIADARLPFDSLSASLVVDGNRVTASRLAAQSGTAWIEASGRALFEKDYPIELDYRASVDLTRAAGWWNRTSTLKGRAALAGHVAGPFLSPTATARADAAGFAWLTLSPGRLTADALLTGPGVQVQAFALDVPEITARGKGFLSWSKSAPRSTLDATWRASLLRRLGPMVELKPKSIPLVSAEGTAVVNWPGFAPDLAGLAGRLETRVRSGNPDGDDHGIVNMVGGNARWQVDWRQWLPGETTARGQFALRIDPERFGQSAVAGTLDVSTANGKAAITRMAELDVSLPEAFRTRLEGARATLTGPVRGSVAMPQWQAAVTAEDVVVSGLRGISVGGTFDLDPRQLVTKSLALKAPGTEVRLSGAIGILEAGSNVSFDGVIDAGWASTPFAPAEWPVGGSASVKGSWVTRDDADDLEVAFESSAATLAAKSIGPVQGHVHSGLAAVTGAVSVPELGCRFSGSYDLTEAQAHTARAECIHADVVRWLTLGGVAPALTTGIHLSVDGTIDASGTFENLDAAQFTIGLDRLSGDIQGQAVALAAPTIARWTRGTLDAGASTITVGGATIAVGPAANTPSASSVTLSSSLANILALLPPGSIPSGLVADGTLRVEARVPHADPRNSSVQASADIASVTRDAVHIASGVGATARLDPDRLELLTLKGTLLGATVDATATAPAAWVAPWLARAPVATTTPAGPDQARITGTIDAQFAAVMQALGTAVPKLTGAARMSVELVANAPRLDELRGVITAEGFTVETRTGTFTQDGPWRIPIENGLAGVNALAITGPGSRLEASGHVGLSPGSAVDLRVSGTASMSLLDAFVAPRVDGAADVELRVGGSLDKPSLDGALTLRDVSALSPTAKLVLAGVGGRITFRPGLIESVDLKGQLNGGSVGVSGSLPFDSSHDRGGLRLTMRDIFVEYPPGLRNRISADLMLSGGLDQPVLTGKATFLTEPYRESLPQMAQLLTALTQPSRGGASDPAGLPGRIALDVALVSSIPLRLDNSLGQIELLPQVSLVGTVAQPGLLGSVAILDGSTIRLQSRTYTLADSRMDFDPDDGLVPRLRVMGTAQVGAYAVTLQISGPADAIEMSLSSDPPLPERDLQVMLLTGQVGDSGAQVGGSRQFAITALSSDLLGVAGQAFGLDYVRLGSENFELVSSDLKPTTRLTVSKTLLTRFELIFSDNLDNNATTWIVVYKPRLNIELRVASLDNLERTVEVRHQFTFGPGGPAASGVAKSKAPARTAVLQETVASVSILGEPDETTARLRSLLGLTPGTTFDYRKWLADHERIRSFYNDAGYLTARVIPTRTALDPAPGTKARVALEYRITRGPATSVVVTGWSADAPFIARLRMAWAATTFDQFAADDMSRVAREMLVDRGYVLPVVHPTVSETSPGVLLATINVQTGPRVTKRTFVFEGASVFSEQDLLAIATAAGVTDSAWRDPEVLCLAISEAYAAAGYRGAVVKAGLVLVVGASAVMPVRIVEGPATHVGAVTVAGVPAERLAAARDATGLVSGALLPSGEERIARLRLERHFRNLGYRNAKVAVGLPAAGQNGLIDITLTVTEGRQQVIRSVRVEGVQTTRPALVDRAVQLKPGDPAGQDAIFATQRRLYQLGVFNAADIRIEPVEATPAETAKGVVPVNAVVSVVEPRRYQFVYGVEFSNAYGPVYNNFENALGVAADVRDRNLFGRGMSLSLGGRYDHNIKSVRTLFTVPRLGTWPIRTNVYVGLRDQKTVASDGSVVDEASRTASVEQRWRPGSWVDVTWGYSVSDNRFSTTATQPLSDLWSNGILAAVNGAVVFDHRDNMLDSKRGWFHSSSLQQGAHIIGSDLRYTRYVGQVFFFAPAGPLVSATAVRFGSLWNMDGNTSLAATDLLFKTGGSQTVRGYAQEGLGAGTLQGIPIGGTRLLVLNQEFRVSVSKLLQGVVFADAGNAFGPEGIQLRHLAVGLGFGVRIRTPLVPLRADFGFPIPRRPGDPTFRWYISVGQIF